MKRKTPAGDPLVVPKELLENAKRALEAEKPKRIEKCIVCGSECPEGSPEQLCWVCRRLKISAWLESEQQLPAQE